MSRGTHSKKEVEDALAYAEISGWRVQSGGRGHAWGKMYCPYNDAECRVRGVLHFERLEYPKESRKSRPAPQAYRGQLHDSPVAIMCEGQRPEE